VINKQNRTSCKACRLRKCLVVGMSKTGSRYGRRSNWFKIHCLLQEQSNYGTNSQAPQSFRSPVTPTLQDGSLPFVNSQLREAMPIDRDPGQVMIPRSLPTEATPETLISGNFAVAQLNSADKRLHEESLTSLKPEVAPNADDGEWLSRQNFFEAIRRSHIMKQQHMFDSTAIQNLLSSNAIEQHQNNQPFNSSRQIERLFPNGNMLKSPYLMNLNEWYRGGSSNENASKKLQSTECSSGQMSRIKFPSPDLGKTSGISSALHSPDDNASTDESKNIAIDIKTESTLNSKLHGDVSSKVESPKGLLTEEERLMFLKSTSNSQVNTVKKSLAPAQVETSSSTSKIHNDLFSKHINSNVFPFSPYSNGWPSLLSFPPFRQFQPLVHPGMIPSMPPFQINGMTNPLLSPDLMNSVMSPLPSPVDPMESTDNAGKKRIIDVILQGQRTSPSVLDSCKRRVSSPTTTVPFSQTLDVTSTSISGSLMHLPVAKDQPMDLSVKRKRKVPRNEAPLYYSSDDDMESDYVQSKLDFRDKLCVLSKTEAVEDHPLDQSCDLLSIKKNGDNQANMPLKIMKLEALGD